MGQHILAIATFHNCAIVDSIVETIVQGIVIGTTVGEAFHHYKNYHRKLQQGFSDKDTVNVKSHYITAAAFILPAQFPAVSGR